jgi:hypothetical protein
MRFAAAQSPFLIIPRIVRDGRTGIPIFDFPVGTMLLAVIINIHIASILTSERRSDEFLCMVTASRARIFSRGWAT